MKIGGERAFFALCVALLIGLLLGEVTGAEELTGRQIMEKVVRLNRGKDERATSQMVIHDSRGGSRKRELAVFQKAAEGDDDKIMMRFTSPARIKGTSLLTIEHSDRDDDQWVFLPALRKSKRIASSDKTESFAGTDFTYEDMRTEDLERMRYELKGKEEYEGQQCYIVAAYPSTPEKKEESGYSKRVLSIRSDEFLVAKVEYYDKAERHAKTLKISDFRRVNGLWRGFSSIMENLLQKTKTIWTSKEREINVGLSDSMFTKRELERSS